MVGYATGLPVGECTFKCNVLNQYAVVLNYVGRRSSKFFMFYKLYLTFISDDCYKGGLRKVIIQGNDFNI